MHLPDDDNKLCTKCIGNKRFITWIRAHGRRGKCDFDPSHGRTCKVVTVADFAAEVDEYFRENYQWGEEQPYCYEQQGEPYRDILANDLECDEELVTAIAKSLPDVSDRDVAHGAEPFYDDCKNYESTAEVQRRDQDDWEEYWYENRFRYQWKEFCEKVQYERRFFKTKELLDKLFGKPNEYENGKINPVYALKPRQKLHRARLIDEEFSEKQLRANPAKELGAPPREKARAGRMNVEFIPAFYAAFSEETAIAEIRPGIGEEVAVGEFVLTRELRVFDFTAFSKADHEDRKECYGHTRYDFIKQMENEISRQVRVFQKQREYIATQIVAEYLKEYFSCDAVIYRSSMIKDSSAENRNIVILPRTDEFVGDPTSVLAFSCYEVKEVSNVTYELMH